jgi:hypothetical protein
MARPLDTPHAVAAYRGEVWTDGRGVADIELPPDAKALRPPLDYELRVLERPATVRVTAELADGRFTIATNAPHVKVAWRLAGRLPAPTTRGGTP